MEFIDYVYVVVIAVMYYMFTTRSVNYAFGKERAACIYPTFSNEGTGKEDMKEYRECKKISDEQRNEASSKEFQAMIAIGVITLIVSGLVSGGLLSNGLIANGMSLASLLIIICNVFSEWSKMNEVSKLVILGAGLAASMYGAHAYTSGMPLYLN
jgi:hypothetical protein